MTQGAGQEPVVRTATLRDFRVPPYARVPVQSHVVEPSGPEPLPASAPTEHAHAEHPAHHHPAPAHHSAPGAPPEPHVHPEPHSPPVEQPTPAPTSAPDPRPAAAAPLPPVAPSPVEAVPVPASMPAPHPPAAEAAPQPPAPRTSPPPPQEPAPMPADPTLHLGHRATVPPYPAAATPAAPAASDHPGNAFPEDELPEGYTPTERDLPVINRGDTVQVKVSPVPAGEAPAGDGPGPLYVVGDVHGYLDELLAALRAQGLIDENGGWAAGNARLWFLGDFTDRGPDGIGVIDLVMRLSAEAAAAGGYCKALMGNHELLLIGAKRFGDTPVNSGAGTATFQAAWLLNGGQKQDMDRLQDVHLQWMSRLDAVVREDDHLLVHSDTTAYLEYGETIEDVNDTVHEILTRNDADEVWDVFRKFTKRFAFRDDGGPQAVQELLSTYGGSRIVHGHSPIPYLLGQVGTEDGEDGGGPVVHGPHVYADGLAIAMDGGVTMAGKLLVVQLPLND